MYAFALCWCSKCGWEVHSVFVLCLELHGLYFLMKWNSCITFYTILIAHESQVQNCFLFCFDLNSLAAKVSNLTLKIV